MANRNQRPLLLVENQMADLAEAEVAMRALWARVRTLCYRPAVSLEDVDAFCRDLRAVEAGLAAGRRLLQAERERVDE
jgi:hypothetical protein